MELSWRVDGAELSALIERIAARADLSGETGKAVADAMRADVRRQFADAGDPPWAPLSPRTIEQKRKLGYPRLTRKGTIPQSMVQRGHFGPENILLRTGALWASWCRDDDPDHVEERGPNYVSIGSAIEYAERHQTGDPESNLPARPIRVTDRMAEAVSRILVRLEEQA